MAQPRIAARTPNACAGCYGQYVDRVHVDFAAAIEGALVDPSNPRGPHVDWVVLCENCIRSAYKLLPAQKEAGDQVARKIAALTQRVEEAENYASSLEDTLARRPEPAAPREKARQKPKPRPKPNAAKAPRGSRYQPKSA